MALLCRGSGRSPAVSRASVWALGVLVPWLGTGGLPVDAQRGSSRALTIEAVLSAPFPSEIRAAPAGGAIAWVVNERGARNIWVAEPPAYRGHRLTAYTADDGQELSQLAWARDGRTIVYVRGGSPSESGEAPNPTSDLAGQEQAVWRIALGGGPPVRVGAGTEPAVSPVGDLVAFRQRGQIVLASLGEDARGAAKPIGHIRGAASHLRWSPDGRKLAFSSRRGDHAFIGVYDSAERTVTWLAPSVAQDVSPVWSPDGRRIAFIRIPSGAGEVFFGPARAAAPWSIVVADVATGSARTIWRAEPGAGSVFHEVSADDELFWGAGDRIVFPWERDGWTHLYAVPATGGEAAVLLTPGEHEVHDVMLTPDRTALLYSSNQGDIDRRHLWRVPVSGGAPVAVTRGQGIEWSPVVTSAGVVALLHSGARRPATAAIVMRGELRELAPDLLAGYPDEASFVEPEAVIYRAADGLPIHAQLFRPSDARPGERRPALVFVHGGPVRQMLLGFHPMDFYHSAYALNQYFASRGYVVLSINYRSGIGYGMVFREAERYGAAGASEVQDVLGAGLYLAARPDVDPRRIGIFGGSYGGYLTAQALARASDLFAAGVDYAGVHDWNALREVYEPSFRAGEHPDAAAVAHEASPIAWVDRWRSPVLLIHADDDRNVPFSETVRLAGALRSRGVEVEELILADEVHDILLYRNLLRYAHATDEFLSRHLGAAREAVVR
jgi:dipeptidyl aminopeptidase/acylaminoacyl peptidase